MQHLIDRILSEEEKNKLQKIKKSKSKSTHRWIKNILLDLGRSWFGIEIKK